MCPPNRRRRPSGFTLVELLVVFIIIALLAALLLPAIGAAVNNARNAAVSAEINQMAQALADFKSKYGDYPPSRVLLIENGDYSSYVTASTTYTLATTRSPNSKDISNAQIAQRTLSYMRKFFPRFQLSTTGAIYTSTTVGNYPDFNGNGTNDLSTPILLTGDECLVFFLGGVPTLGVTGGKKSYGVTGTSRNPQNPYIPATTSSANRVNPFFEFKTDRLVDVDGDGFPSYLDSLGQNRAYAYFSSYGGTGYDPNDVNFDTGHPFVESDDAGTVSPITLKFLVTFPVSGGPPNIATSPAPNPYTTTSTIAKSPVVYQSPQSFQIISAGRDGQYGVGGVYSPTGETSLPLDTYTTSPYNTTDTALRNRERDNLTNFNTGRLD